MANQFISRAAAAANTVALPSFTPGDIAIVYAYRNGSTTVPSLPAGWVDVASGTGANTNSRRIGRRVLQAGDTTIGTWTNATSVQVLVFRGQHPTTPIGVLIGGGTNTTTLTSPALSGVNTTGTATLLFLGGSKATNASTPVLTGQTTVSQSGNNITSLCAAYRLNNAANWPATNWSAAVNATGNRMDVVELLAAPPGLGSGNVAAAAALAGSGRTDKRGSGSIAAVSSGSGEGFAPASQIPAGSGVISTIATLTGAGRTTKAGSGSLQASGAILGQGRVIRSGLGSVLGVAGVLGAGSSARSGTGGVAASGALIGVGLIHCWGSGIIQAQATLFGSGPFAGLGFYKLRPPVATAAIQYDGSPAAELAIKLLLSVDSANLGHPLQALFGNIQVGDWVTLGPGGMEVLSNVAFLLKYEELP